MKKKLLSLLTSILTVVIISFSLTACSELPKTQKPCTVTAVYDSSMGNVSITDENGEEKSEFTSGNTAVVQVSANEGYRVLSFKAANSDKALIDGKYTFTVTSDTQITVEFTSLYSVTATYNQAYGTVEVTDANGTAKEWFDNSESVYVKVTPASGYTLTGFSRNGVSYTYNDGYSFTVNGANVEIKAEFYPTDYLPLVNALNTVSSSSYTVNISYNEYEQYDVFVTDKAVYSCTADDGIIIMDLFDDDTALYGGYYADKNSVYAFATIEGALTRLGVVPKTLSELHASFAKGEDVLELFDFKSEGVYELKEGVDVAQTLSSYFMEIDEGNFYIDYYRDSFTGLTLNLTDGALSSVTVPYGEYGEEIVFTYSDIGATGCGLEFVNLNYVWSDSLGTYTDGDTTVVIDREGVKYNGAYVETKYSVWGLELSLGVTVNNFIELDGESVYLHMSNLELFLITGGDEFMRSNGVNVIARLLYTADEKGTIPNSYVGIWEGDGITYFDPAAGGFVGTHYRVEISGTENEVNKVVLIVDGGEGKELSIIDYRNGYLYVKESADSGFNFTLGTEGEGDDKETVIVFMKMGGDLGLMLDMGVLHKQQPNQG